MKVHAALLSLALLLANAGSAYAHGFLLEVREEGGEISGEAYFSDGDPPGAGTWKVFAGASETPLGSGPLAEGGRFRFRPPGPGTYRCEVREVGLHLAQASLTLGAPSPRASATPAAPLSVAGRGTQAPRETPGAPAEASHPTRGWGKARLKRLLTGLGAIAVLGVGLFRFQQRRERREEEDEEESGNESDEPGEAGEDEDHPTDQPTSHSAQDAEPRP